MHTPVHRACDSYVDSYLRLEPLDATALGVTDYDDQLPDLSESGRAARTALMAGALREVSALEPADDGERVAKSVFTERLGVEIEVYEAGLLTGDLNVIASPAQEIRQTFDLMPTDSDEAWHTIARRLAALPAAMASYRDGLRHAAASGRVAAARQVRIVAEQCSTWIGLGAQPSFFTSFVEDGPESLRGELAAGAEAANQAYGDLAVFLTEELLAKAPAEDAVGEEVYGLFSRRYLGARVDLRESYEWGWAEFLRIEAEMKEVAHRIRHGASIPEAAHVLDGDPRYRVAGRAAFREWMQELSDGALADLRGTHFEIPDPIMRLDCRIAPPGGGTGAYYTQPSEDFGRPGAMWWSLPPDKDEFSTWREVSTVYHEGVPGHHLQIATAQYSADRLNRFQRMLAWVPAYGEGWALYAERLMREYGYLSDDGNLLGMLNENLYRAARVIIDIGMHLKLEIPRGTGFHEGERWTPELGLEFMLTRTITEHALVRDEIDRYLGWPGQAPAYKLGERLWLSARDEARARPGFDLKDFHMRALRMGPMGLDTLREHLA
ncbi:hypothetical protein BLA60_21735 [Actinophytocola xinjiangensis]|uniref:DUF885 domain-containing protein n=1 Tax=Actinophytocola xinjiangensis TaxID=485602 RepID=A0A7Z1AY27_9PSEU|nr:DUF885 domain-containing protein [Actinophytocola xinjiangensis]OLF08651.1 hypothetical protein BLA60_21735 [Actinophytocola xinjiangensis]